MVVLYRRMGKNSRQWCEKLVKGYRKRFEAVIATKQGAIKYQTGILTVFHLLLHTFYLFVTPFVDIEDRNQGSTCCMIIKCPVVLEVNICVLFFVS